MRVAAVVAVVSAAVVPWNVRPVAACSCAVPRTADYLEHSDTVFAGRVLEVGRIKDGQSSGTLIDVTLAVDRAWLGAAEAEMVVRTAASEASCGYTFEAGKRYIVYARTTGERVSILDAPAGTPGQPGFEKVLETSFCSPTREFDDDSMRQLEAVTGPGRVVTQESGAEGGVPAVANGDGATTTAELAVALAVTAALGGATVALSRRR